MKRVVNLSEEARLYIQNYRRIRDCEKEASEFLRTVLVRIQQDVPQCLAWFGSFWTSPVRLSDRVQFWKKQWEEDRCRLELKLDLGLLCSEKALVRVIAEGDDAQTELQRNPITDLERQPLITAGYQESEPSYIFEKELHDLDFTGNLDSAIASIVSELNSLSPAVYILDRLRPMGRTPLFVLRESRDYASKLRLTWKDCEVGDRAGGQEIVDGAGRFGVCIKIQGTGKNGNHHLKKGYSILTIPREGFLNRIVFVSFWCKCDTSTTFEVTTSGTEKLVDGEKHYPPHLCAKPSKLNVPGRENSWQRVLVQLSPNPDVGKSPNTYIFILTDNQTGTTLLDGIEVFEGVEIGEDELGLLY